MKKAFNIPSFRESLRKDVLAGKPISNAAKELAKANWIPFVSEQKAIEFLKIEDEPLPVYTCPECEANEDGFERVTFESNWELLHLSSDGDCHDSHTHVDIGCDYQPTDAMKCCTCGYEGTAKDFGCDSEAPEEETRATAKNAKMDGGWQVIDIDGQLYKCRRRHMTASVPEWSTIEAYDYLGGYGFCVAEVKRPETLEKIDAELKRIERIELAIARARLLLSSSDEDGQIDSGECLEILIALVKESGQ